MLMYAGNMEEREPQRDVEQTRDWLAEAADAPPDLTEFEHFEIPKGGDLDNVVALTHPRTGAGTH